MGEDKLSFEEALEAARSSNVFTTHRRCRRVSTCSIPA